MGGQDPGGELDCLDQLPPPPAMVTRLLACFGRDDIALADVEAIVRQDPLLAARILQAANCAAYGTRLPARTTLEALLRLGLDEVRRLALALAASRALPSRGTHQEYVSFWTHSLGVANLAHEIARMASRRAGAPPADEVFIAGLFHDLGQLALAHARPAARDAVARLADERGLGHLAAETAVYGADHGEAGARVARHWHMPDFVIDAGRLHLRAPEADGPTRWHVAIVAGADLLHSAQGLGDLGETRLATLEPAAWDALGLAELGLSIEDALELSCTLLEEAARSTLILSVAA